MEPKISIIHGQVQSVTQTPISSLFDHIADTVSDQNAVTFEGSSITFSQLRFLANKISRRLSSELDMVGKGITAQKDAIIALYMAPGDKRIITLLAILKLQAAYLPLDSILPIERMRHIVNESKPICIITTDEIYDHAKEISLSTLVVTYENLLTSPEDPVCDAIGNWEQRTAARGYQGDPLVCILYTSGSTGTPKGCRLRTSSVLNRLSWQWACFPFQKNEVGCHKTSILFVDSLTEIFSCLLKGIPVVVASKNVTQNVLQLVQLMERHHVTRVVVVPSLLYAILHILKLSDSHLPEIRAIVCSGETLSPELAHEFFRVFSKNTLLVNLYGSTETTGDVTYETFASHNDVDTCTNEAILSIGHPIWNCSVYILDDTGNPVPLGNVGEIYISGHNVTEGYMGQGQDDVLLTNKYSKDPDHSTMYKMGDLGKIVHGRIIYQGRRDNLVKVRGYRVNTLEVENTLKGIEEIDRMVILGYQMPNDSTILLLFYTVLPGKKLPEDDIIRQCREFLPPYMTPRLIKLEKIPLQRQTGKVDRQALKALFAKQLQTSKREDDFQEESIPQKLLLLISEELGIPNSEFSLDSHFFSVGGNSISAISVIVKLKEKGMHLSVNDFFMAKNIKEIGDVIMENYSAPMRETRILVDKYRIMPLSKIPDQREAMTVLVQGFSKKNPLDALAGTSEAALYRLLESIWPPILKDNLSFVVQDLSRKIVAVTILLDARTELQPEFEMEAIGEINDAVEKPVKRHLLENGGEWIDSLLNAVDASLPEDEGIQILQLMEDEVLHVARQAGFNGIVTVNSHPVTMNLDEHFFGYEVHNVLHVKSFQYKGEYPFHNADDNYNIKAMVKRLK